MSEIDQFFEIIKSPVGWDESEHPRDDKGEFSTTGSPGQRRFKTTKDWADDLLKKFCDTVETLPCWGVTKNIAQSLTQMTHKMIDVHETLNDKTNKLNGIHNKADAVSSTLSKIHKKLK